MKTKFKFSLIRVLSVIILLMCICLPIGATNSWFNVGGKNLLLEVNIGSINMSVYQGETEINIDKESYVNFSGEIVPDKLNSLTLSLKNNEASGTDSYYVRYKIEIVALNRAGGTVLDGTITGASAPTTSTAGFVLGADDWFYYQNNDGEKAKYPGGANLTMLTGFTIPYSQFESAKFNMDIVKIVVTVEGSTLADFSEGV